MARGMTTVVPGGRRLLVVMMALLLAMAGLLPGWGAGVARAAACVVASPLNSGPGSLRSAMNNIDGFSGCTDITIAFSIDGPVDIFLSSALPVVGGHLSITGPGASLLTIHGGTSDVFTVTSGGDLAISGMTVTGALSVVRQFGGTATVTNSIFKETVFGVFNPGGGTATVANTTFDNNNVGVFTSGVATVTNSTFSVGDTGVAVIAGGTATVTNSTLAGLNNGVSADPGGTATLTNTLLAKGTAANCTGGGAFTNGGYNLADDATCFANGANSSIVVAAGATGLAPAGLADNGGPTPTIALLPASPAVNAAADAVCAQSGAGKVNSLDQRGAARPNGVHCDIGAYEAGSPVATTLSLAPASGNYGGNFTLTATLTRQVGTQAVAGRVVAFTQGGTAVCANAGGGYPAPCPQTNASGAATLSVALGATAVGNSPIGAAFAGDFAYTATSAGNTLTVGQAAQTIAFTPSTLPDHVYGDASFTVSATATSGLPVTFTAGPSTVCTATGATGSTITLKGVGTCTVVAHQAGNASFAAAPDLSGPFAVRASLTVTTPGGGIVTPGDGSFAPGAIATLTAAPDDGQLFTGWTVDGVFVGYANPLALPMTKNRAVVAGFAPAKTFCDVSPSDPAYEAVRQLSARGIINGFFNAGNQRCFGTNDPTLRHQMAALIVRAMPGWQDETWPSPFTDPTDDAELTRRVATLGYYNVAQGYQPEVCQERGQTPPCYGPLDTVKYGQVMLFISRAMVAKGYWVLQPDDRTVFPDQNGAAGADPNTDRQTLDHRMVVTYVHYAGSPPDVADAHAPFAVGGVANGGWGDAAPRAWFARALWQALSGYFQTNHLP